MYKKVFVDRLHKEWVAYRDYVVKQSPDPLTIFFIAAVINCMNLIATIYPDFCLLDEVTLERLAKLEGNLLQTLYQDWVDHSENKIPSNLIEYLNQRLSKGVMLIQSSCF